MNAKELRTKTKEDLEKILQEERVKLRDLNFKMAGSQVKNFNEFKEMRRNIAAILTILRELSKSEAIGKQNLNPAHKSAK